MPDNHEHWMRRALDLARQARDQDEVPVGAVIVRGGEIIGEGSNRPVIACDPTAHAEIIALRDAAEKESNYRLPGSTLYVTIEPCTMCVGAMIHARVGMVVFGAREPRAGVLVSNLQLAGAGFYNHRLAVQEGVLAEECAELMSAFFRMKRG